MKNPTWTTEEDQLLILHRGQGKTSREIAAFIKRAPHAISARWRYIHLSDEQREIENQRKRAAIKEIIPVTRIEQRITVPDHVLADRERRLMAERSLTAAFFGDPEPNRVRL